MQRIKFVEFNPQINCYSGNMGFLWTKL